MALSTTEAEYCATSMAAQEITWLVQILGDLHQVIESAIPLYCDNQSAIRLAENPLFHSKTKHVEIQYHFIREKVLKEEVELRHIDSENQSADILRKSLSGRKFEVFRQKLGIMRNIKAGVEGEC